MGRIGRRELGEEGGRGKGREGQRKGGREGGRRRIWSEVVDYNTKKTRQFLLKANLQLSPRVGFP